MAQLRQDHQEFVDRRAVILVIGPDDAPTFRNFWETHQLPFAGLADPGHAVAKLYRQQVKLLRFGRMPALFVVDMLGKIRYIHHAESMRDIPSNEEILSVLDRLIDEEKEFAQAPGLRGDSPLDQGIHQPDLPSS